jgi:hypothetical protein
LVCSAHKLTLTIASLTPASEVDLNAFVALRLLREHSYLPACPSSMGVASLVLSLSFAYILLGVVLRILGLLTDIAYYSALFRLHAHN